MKVVVTGGAGFVGANLCRILTEVQEINEVLVIDDLSSGRRENLRDVGVPLIEASILDPDALDEAFAGASAVVHLAARPSVPYSLEDPLASHHANATGTVQVLEAARRAGNPHVIAASSSSVYGGNPLLPKREDMVPMPRSPYAASKLAMEGYVLAWASSFALDVLVFRFFNVYGPLQAAGHAYAAVVPSFIEAALSGRPLTIYGDGLQTRDFTYVDSVTKVIATAVRRRICSDQPVNLAFGTRSTLLELATELETVLGHPLKRRHVDPRSGDVRDSQADQTHIRSLFPGTSELTLGEGLSRTVAWFQGG